MEEFERLRENADEIWTLLNLLGSSRARFLIIARLAAGECSVSELSAAVDLPQSLVSQHLRRLRTARLVAARRRHRRIFYRLDNGRIRALLDLLLAHHSDDAARGAGPLANHR